MFKGWVWGLGAFIICLFSLSLADTMQHVENLHWQDTQILCYWLCLSPVLTWLGHLTPLVLSCLLFLRKLHCLIFLFLTFRQLYLHSVLCSHFLVCVVYFFQLNRLFFGPFFCIFFRNFEPFWFEQTTGRPRPSRGSQSAADWIWDTRQIFSCSPRISSI